MRKRVGYTLLATDDAAKILGDVVRSGGVAPGMLRDGFSEEEIATLQRGVFLLPVEVPEDAESEPSRIVSPHAQAN